LDKAIRITTSPALYYAVKIQSPDFKKSSMAFTKSQSIRIEEQQFDSGWQSHILSNCGLLLNFRINISYGRCGIRGASAPLFTDFSLSLRLQVDDEYLI
jgi:hypothetical protein